LLYGILDGTFDDRAFQRPVDDAVEHGLDKGFD
jgi:hypothetical protein